MFLSALPLISAAGDVIQGECGENLTFKFRSSTGELIISGTGAMYDYTWHGPWGGVSGSIKTIEIKEGVTTIGKYAFADHKALTSVKLPNSLVTISDSAFVRCNYLSEINFAKNLTHIGNNAFSVCGLKSVNIPGSVERIGADAFRSCWSLTDITLNEGTKVIGSSAFTETGETEIVIPNSVVEIGSHAFSRCGNLVSVKLGSSLTTIGSFAFAFCSKLPSIYFPDNVTSIGNNCLYDCDSLVDIRLSNNLPTISGGLFSASSALQNITIPEGLTIIGVDAFRDCVGLSNITLPASLVEVHNWAFECPGLYHVLFTGTQAQWQAIDFGVHNGSVVSGLKHYNAKGDEVITKQAKYGEYLYCTLCEEALTCAHNNIEMRNLKEATCTEAGYSGDAFCTDCKKVLANGKETSAIGHDYAPAVVRTEATCTEGGEKVQICRNCSHEIPESIPAIGHDYAPAVVRTEATCTTDGEKVQICRNCSHEIPESIPAIGHDYAPAVVKTEATCTADGVKAQICRNCKHEIPESIPAIGHNYADPVVATEATCTSNGAQIEVCLNCEHEIVRQIPATGHIYDDGICTICGKADPHASIKPTEKPTEKPQEPSEPSEPSKPSEPSQPSNPFKDVKTKDYFYTPVLWAVGQDITKGTSSTTFSPNAPCTRGQIVTFLWRACGSPEPTSKNNPFKDVKSNEYYYKAVLWAVEQGITTGLSSTNFGPNATCTRGQVATFLWRSQGEPAPKSSNNPFKDVKSSDYYFKAVLWAVENDVTQGMGGGKFAPNASCTRGQIVTFLYRAIA